MKLINTLLATVAISTSLVSIGHASESNKKYYVGAKIGQVAVGESNDSISFPAYGIYGGVTMDKNRTIEVEYAQGSKTEDTGTSVTEADFSSAGVYGVYTYHVPQHTNLYGKIKAGTAFVSNNYVYKNAVTTITEEVEGITFGYGLAAGYEVTPNIAVQAEYAVADVGFMNVSAHFTF